MSKNGEKIEIAKSFLTIYAKVLVTKIPKFA